MNFTFLKKWKRFPQEAGIALLTTLLLLFLMSSLLVGFSVLLLSNQKLSGSNDQQVRAFYGAEAGMEQLTAGLGNLFNQTYSPSSAQVSALATTPPYIPNISYLTGDGKSGYTITPLAVDANGNPAPTITTIKSGAYQGMTALATEYVLMVNARSNDGREVTLKRTTQTVGIPMFQFGIWSDSDLDYFPGPDFSFGGRTHTNGNLFLAAGGTLTFKDKVDAYKDVIRYALENGHPTSSGYTGTVQITTTPGCTSCFRALGSGEGSILAGVGTPGATPNTNWPQISMGSAPTYYGGNLQNGKGAAPLAQQYAGAAKQLNLGIVTIGGGATQQIDLIRRPAVGESTAVTAERYFAQASLKILISDDPTDIMNLPCVDPNTQPFDLSKITVPPGVNGVNWAGYAPAAQLYKNLVANKVLPLPLPASGSAGAYSATDGYWLPGGFPIEKGFIKIEEQTTFPNNPCGNITDVTLEVLGLGYIGRNLNPVPQALTSGVLAPQWVEPVAGVTPVPVGLPAATLPYQNGPTIGNPVTAFSGIPAVGNCPDPHPNAIIRLARIRDNPSSISYNPQGVKTPQPPYQTSAQEVCGFNWAAVPYTTVTNSTSPTVTKGNSTLLASDIWPNTLFDTREGVLRDHSMTTGLPAAQALLPTLNGVMHYVELDAKNLTRWFSGQIGTTGNNTRDTVVAPNNFLVYFSDRRGNYTPKQTWVGNWPPLSFTQRETGEYGWYDLVNLSDAANGCSDNTFDAAEDYDSTSQFYTYGGDASFIHAPGVAPAANLKNGQLGIYANLAGTGVINNGNICANIPAYSKAPASDNIWPMMLASSTNSARENPPLFFRRALKIVNGTDLTQIGACPNGVNCGLAIAAENPVYIQGDFNANSLGNGWSDPSVATSVAGDAVTLLSSQWSDVNSFYSPYALSTSTTFNGKSYTVARNGVTTWYRAAIIGGKPLYFPQPAGQGQDYGTDGGVHNFLRYIEAWSGTLEYQGSIINLFYSRQANSTFKCCATVYSPPTRGYDFDVNFLNPTLLPPRTPLFRDVNTTGWTRLLLPGQYN